MSNASDKANELISNINTNGMPEPKIKQTGWQPDIVVDFRMVSLLILTVVGFLISYVMR